MAANACERGTVPANQVLVIGDSFFATSHQITAYLEGLARNAGAVSVGERYRDRSSLLANALALGGNGIADQYTSGVSEAEVKVVIMNGGGADALLGSCDSANASCAVVSRGRGRRAGTVREDGDGQRGAGRVRVLPRSGGCEREGQSGRAQATDSECL